MFYFNSFFTKGHFYLGFIFLKKSHVYIVQKYKFKMNMQYSNTEFLKSSYKHNYLKSMTTLVPKYSRMALKQKRSHPESCSNFANI